MANDLKLFDESEIPSEHQKHWQGMPEFNQQDLQPFQSIIVNFETKEHRDEFAKLVDQKLTYQTPSIWYPKVTIERVSHLRYIDKENEA